MREDVESLARALGVWWDGLPRRPPTAAPWCMSRRDGVHRIHRCEDTAITFPGIVVDPPTAALILLGHARGLRVDTGECPACSERGSKRGPALWEWSHYTTNSRAALLLWIARHSADVGWSHKRQESVGAADMFGMAITRFTAERPCPACTVDGKPTGRHAVAWERAVVDAMSKHTDTRTPLAVLADQFQARGDILGTLLAAWLAGPEVLGGPFYDDLRRAVRVAIAEAAPDERATVPA